MRGRHRGPRQPGGGKQIAGPRYSFSHVRHHPEVAAKRPPKGDGGQAGKSRLGKSWSEIGTPISSGRSSFEARRGRAPQDDGKQSAAAARGDGKSTVQNVSVTGDESLPRRPSPSNVASTRTPFAVRGTSHSVVGS